MNEQRVRDAVEVLLTEAGEDPTREGLARTPARVASALRFLTSGYDADVEAVVNDALFTVDCNEMVIVRDIDFYSLCEHRRRPVLERLTNQIATTLADALNPLGVGVVIEATHLCMLMRGVEQQNSFAVTSAMLGGFREDARTRMEFLELLKLRGGMRSALDPASLAVGAETP